MLARLLIAALALAAAQPVWAQSMPPFDILWPADTRAFCASPETWSGAVPGLTSRVQRVADLTRAAEAAQQALGGQPYDEKARQAALIRRDQAALAGWDLDLECTIRPLRYRLDASRSRATLARRAAMAAYEAYDREPSEAAFAALKSAQEAMWDARERQDIDEAEYRRLRAIQRAVSSAGANPVSRAPAGFVNRLQIYTAQNALARIEDKASPEAGRLIRRIADLRATSLTVVVTPAMAPLGDIAELPAYPPGSDWQPSRPAVLPVLPPNAG